MIYANQIFSFGHHPNVLEGTSTAVIKDNIKRITVKTNSAR